MEPAPSRILLIEEDALTRRMLRLALEDEGHKVVEAVDPGAAMVAATSERPGYPLAEAPR